MQSIMRCEITDSWDHLLTVIPDDKRDIYFTSHYLKLYEDDGHKAFCAVCTDQDRIMLMPFLRGEINGLYDFETAYGYGGPITNNDDPEWCGKAFDSIYDHLKQNNYLCGFTRFHPVLENEKLVREDTGAGDETRSIRLIYDRQTVAIKTSEDPDLIWTHQISSKNRNMIRKAEKNQLVFRAEYDMESYQEFIGLYRATMHRLAADDFYFFENCYFDSMKEGLAGNSFLGTVRKDGKLICAAIFMYSKYYGHYHLEGSDRNYSSLGANNLLLWKAACEMHHLGVREFHLGGGTSSHQDDPLYRFKKAFSPYEKQFWICKEIFDREAYTAVCREWEKNNQGKNETYGNRLLKYRY